MGDSELCIRGSIGDKRIYRIWMRTRGRTERKTRKDWRLEAKASCPDGYLAGAQVDTSATY